MTRIMMMTLVLVVSAAWADDGRGKPIREGAAVTREGQATRKRQTTCPVMGGAIDKSLYVDHDGKRLYLCCKGCEAPVRKDPAKYIQKLEAEGVTLDRLQTLCPVMGGAIDRKQYVDHDGQRIYVCCQGCIAAIKKEPARYIKSLEDAGVALDPADKKDAASEPRPGVDGDAGP